MTDLEKKAIKMAFDAAEPAMRAAIKKIEELRAENKALRQALAQPEQEQPKHWSDCAVYNEPAYPKGECDCGGFDPNNKWHGLTEKEAESLAFDVIADGVSKILAQPEQEPAAWQDPQYKTLIEPHKAHPDWIPLYTAPPNLEAAVLAEREACAKVCDDWPNGRDDVCLIAAAIRGRNEK